MEFRRKFPRWSVITNTKCHWYDPSAKHWHNFTHRPEYFIWDKSRIRQSPNTKRQTTRLPRASKYSSSKWIKVIIHWRDRLTRKRDGMLNAQDAFDRAQAGAESNARKNSADGSSYSRFQLHWPWHLLRSFTSLILTDHRATLKIRSPSFTKYHSRGAFTRRAFTTHESLDLSGPSEQREREGFG